MTTAIDIIDTAVKIGLGALISGITSYRVIKAQNRHELVKIAQENKLAILREIAEGIEEADHLLNEFIHTCYKYEHNSNQNELKEKTDNLVNAQNIVNKAKALANLVGFSKLATAVGEYGASFTDLYYLIANNIEHIDYDKANEKGEILNNKKNNIAPLISAAYSQLSV